MQTVLKSSTDAMPATVERVDLYRPIHKGLRAFMSATLAELGRLDGTDNAEVKRVLDQHDELLNFCQSHIEKENQYVHSAIERHHPGASREIAIDHEEHADAIKNLQDAAEAVAAAIGAARQSAIHSWYRLFALFVAENLHHMEVEESKHNALLWSACKDKELIGILAAIVCATSTNDLKLCAQWVVPNLAPDERLAFVAGTQALLPAEVFCSVLALVQTYLPAKQWAALCTALSLPSAQSVLDGLMQTPAPNALAQLVQRFADAAFVHFRADDVAALVTRQFVAHPWVALGVSPGPAGIAHVVAAFGMAFDQTRVTLEDVITQGDRVAVRYFYEGRHCGDLFGVPPTGKRFRLQGIMIARIEENKIAEFWREEDMLGLQQQLGVVLLHDAQVA